MIPADNISMPSVMQFINNVEQGTVGLEWHRKRHDNRLDLDWIWYGDKIIGCYKVINEKESELLSTQAVNNTAQANFLLNEIEYYNDVLEELYRRRTQNINFDDKLNNPR